MIEGTLAITVTLPIQKPGAPATFLRMRSAPLGMQVQARLVHLGASPSSPIRAGWRARADRGRSAHRTHPQRCAVASPDPSCGTAGRGAWMLHYSDGGRFN